MPGSRTFRGYLIAVNTESGIVQFPHEYIELGSYNTTPNHREEIKAYRDDNTRNLIRVTAAGRKTSITFKTRPNLHQSELEEILSFFTDHESNAAERKITLIYWNTESMNYKTGTFYRPNMQYTIKCISSSDIIYDSFTFDLIEY